MKIAEIWRYPVKSMLGEQLDQATVGPGGIQGDRCWAVVDRESGVSLSAKRYPDLLQCQAWTTDRGVMIRVPDSGEYLASSADVAHVLSDLLERNVTTRSAEATETIQHEFPTDGESEDETFLYMPETAAFFDCAPLQLLTTATLNKLRQLLPSSIIHPARFRPNFLVETSATGFVENDWVNNEVILGSLRCQVYDDTRRCIMVTIGQEDFPQDMDVIRAIVQSNERRAGVALKTQSSCLVSRGEGVEVLT